MLRYALRRLAGLLPTLLVIVTVSFFVIRLAPGGPFEQEQTLTPQVRANLERAYGLERPILLQYWSYLQALARGDFGPSFKQQDFSVSQLICAGLPVSSLLGISAIVLSIGLGMPLGLLASLRRDRALDHAVSALAVLAIALPAFVTGPLLALLFGIYLHWLPVGGWEGAGAPRYLVLPVLTLALPVIAAVARLTRGSFLEVFRADFILAAQARGIGRFRLLYKHALRPALLPVVSYLGPASAFVVTGSLVVETVFGLPGTGRYLVQGAINRDYTLVMGMVIVYGSLVLLLNLLADLVYGWLDPHVRHE